MGPLFLFCFFSLFHPVFLSTLEPDRNKHCPPFQCGNLGDGEIQFPYRKATAPENCGIFAVDDCDQAVQKIQLEKEGKWYRVESISQGSTITITDNVLENHLKANSCKSFNFTLPNLHPYPHYASFHVRSDTLTMFKCRRGADISPPQELQEYNYTACEDLTIYYYLLSNKALPSTPPNCSTVQLPANLNRSYHDIFGLLTAHFSLDVDINYTCYGCMSEGGNCSETRNGQFKCIGEKSSKKGNIESMGWKLGLAVSLLGTGILLITIYCFIRKLSSSSFFHWRKAKNHNLKEDFLKKHGYLAQTIYTYSQVKEMTNSFKEKLGQGGFGTVFKGTLPDGREIAVKVLKKSEKDGEEFINEVASISRTSHVNIVSLLGFCFEGSKRALIYEFMPNGSLEKYIYQQNPSGADRQLGWEALYQIALGIARGLEYLHRGCNTRILHFDIKPHNILLDENFCPKISDFGLARVCLERESIISKVTARGTIGYIAPEVFCRNFGGVSHKSDVYSYGMMVFEMVRGRRNLCVGVDKTSEIYFPQWIYKRFELDEELGLLGISNEEENQISRKLIVVSLWCIQTSPSDRPSMGRVVEMLQSSLESLQIPPCPYLSSPSRSPDRSVANSSTTSATSIAL